MALNPILEEFAASRTHELARRITDKFDGVLNQTDEIAAATLKAELETILEERIDALNRD
ncbi:MAG: hypothetical protein ACLQAH_13365 [Limisphaerales bacterium]